MALRPGLLLLAALVAASVWAEPEASPLPEGAVARLEAGGGVRAMAFSPDGDVLAAALENNLLRLWEAASRRERLSIHAAEAGRLEAVAFSPDGKVVATTGSDGAGIRLWSADDGQERRILPPGTPGSRVAFSPDGKTLASADEGTITLWDLATGKAVRQMAVRESRLAALAFSPDGRTLASGGRNGEGNHDAQIRLWDVATGKERLTIKGHARLTPRGWQIRVACLGFSPDGVLLATGGDDAKIHLWDAATGNRLRTLEGHPEGVLAVAFSPNGKTLASAGYDGSVRFWASDTGKSLGTREGHAGWVFSLAFSPDGKHLASAGADGSLLIWEPPVAAQPLPAQTKALDAEALEKLWDDLLSKDRAMEAIRALAAAPDQAVAFLKERLKPAGGDEARIQALIAQLDDDAYAVREAASKALEALGALAEPALRKALAESPSPEVQERARVLLEALTSSAPPLEGEALRAERAVDLLGLIGNDQAREVLVALSKGAAGARLTRAAKRALERLDHPPRRPTPSPAAPRPAPGPEARPTEPPGSP